MRKPRSNSGFSLVESMVGVSILAFVGLALTMGATVALRAQSVFQVRQAATRLAHDRIEILSGVNPAELDNDFDLTETNMTVLGISPLVKFTRVTDVTVNADDSREVVVTVSTPNILFRDHDGDGFNDFAVDSTDGETKNNTLSVRVIVTIPNWAG